MRGSRIFPGGPTFAGSTCGKQKPNPVIMPLPMTMVINQLCQVHDKLTLMKNPKHSWLEFVLNRTRQTLALFKRSFRSRGDKMNARNLKTFSRTPVYVVENHDEVVPHLHRSIGSRHLPMEDLVFVHFDSHPDMLIPKEMQADDVYNKDVLYDTISIENWIVPLVYAGHITSLLWIKPPWCQQIKDKTIQFCVGKYIKTGTIRTSCTENYFVSEVLYCPESQLVDKKRVTLIVLTIEPNGWKETITSSSDLYKVNQSLKKGGNTCENKGGTCETKGDDICETYMCEIKGDSTCKDKGGNTYDISGCSSKTGEVFKEKRYSGNTMKCDSSINSEDTDQSRSKLPQDSNEDNDKVVNKQSIQESDYDDSPTCKRIKLEGLESQTHSKGTSADEINILTSTFMDKIKIIFDTLQDKHFILDIDLDFFSTKNPFQEMYSREEYRDLKELYYYSVPQGLTDEAIKECVDNREQQLNGLKQQLLKFRDQENPVITHPRKGLIEKLVNSLKLSCPGPVDYELLHEAGCTCDDTELPHHVSSQEQIHKLIEATQEFLSHMKKATVITMARSSIDDYCPPDQVDGIQEQVLEMLQDIYLELEVICDYEESTQDC